MCLLFRLRLLQPLDFVLSTQHLSASCLPFALAVCAVVPLLFHSPLPILHSSRRERGAEAAGQAAQRCVAQCVAVLVVKQGKSQVTTTVKELLQMLKSADTSECVLFCCYFVCCHSFAFFLQLIVYNNSSCTTMPCIDFQAQP